MDTSVILAIAYLALTGAFLIYAYWPEKPADEPMSKFPSHMAISVDGSFCEMFEGEVPRMGDLIRVKSQECKVKAVSWVISRGESNAYVAVELLKAKKKDRS